MGVAVLDINALREITNQPLLSKTDPLGLEQRRSKIEAATEVILEHWDEFPQPLKDDVVRNVYLLVNSPNLPFWDRLVRRLFAVIGFLVIAYSFFVDRKSIHSFIGYAQAVDRLVQTVLDAVERDSAACQQAIQAAKEEEGKELKGTTAGDFSDFLRRL